MIINFINGGASGGGVKAVSGLTESAKTGTLVYNDDWRGNVEDGLYMANGTRQECYTTKSLVEKRTYWQNNYLYEGFYEEGLDLGEWKYTVPFVTTNGWVEMDGPDIPEGVETKQVLVEVVGEGNYIFTYDNGEKMVGLTYSGGDWTVYDGLRLPRYGDGSVWDITNGADGTVEFDGVNLVATINDDTYTWSMVDAYGVGGARSYLYFVPETYSLYLKYENGNNKISDSEGNVFTAETGTVMGSFQTLSKTLYPDVEGASYTANTQDIKDTLDSGGTVTFQLSSTASGKWQITGSFEAYDDDSDPTTPNKYRVKVGKNSWDLDDITDFTVLSGGYGSISVAIEREISYEHDETLDEDVVTADIIRLCCFNYVRVGVDPPFGDGGDVTYPLPLELKFNFIGYRWGANPYYIQVNQATTLVNGMTYEGLNLIDKTITVPETATTCEEKTAYEQIGVYRASSESGITGRYSSSRNVSSAGDTFAITSADTVTTSYTNGSTSEMWGWNKSVEFDIVAEDGQVSGYTEIRFAKEDKSGIKFRLTQYFDAIVVDVNGIEICGAPFDYTNPEAWACNGVTYLMPNEPEDVFIGGLTVTPSIIHDSGNSENHYILKFECPDSMCLQNGMVNKETPLALWDTAIRAGNLSRRGMFTNKTYVTTYTKYVNTFTGELGVIEKDGDTGVTKYNLDDFLTSADTTNFVTTADTANFVISTDIRNMVKITQSNYDALVSGGTVDETTFYVIIPDSNNP